MPLLASPLPLFRPVETPGIQGEFAFANDYRLGVSVSAAAAMAEITSGAVRVLQADGELDIITVSLDPDSPRQHRRVLTASLWRWQGRAHIFALPPKPTFRPDEVADLFAISPRHVRRLCAAGAFRVRRYGLRRQIRILRQSINEFIKTRRIDE